MSREAARTTAKSKMELPPTKYNRRSLNFVTGIYSHGSPRYLQMFLKNILKSL